MAETKQEIARWIQAEGSDELREALKAGYNVVGSYIRERARKEFPGFVYAPSGPELLDERANPTADALRLLKETQERANSFGYDSEVRIAYRKPGGIPLHRQKEDLPLGEVIAVRGYLGRDGDLLQQVGETEAIVKVFCCQLALLLGIEGELGALQVIEHSTESERIRALSARIRTRLEAVPGDRQSLPNRFEQVFSPESRFFSPLAVKVLAAVFYSGVTDRLKDLADVI
jgi:hypothetical protein